MPSVLESTVVEGTEPLKIVTSSNSPIESTTNNSTPDRKATAVDELHAHDKEEHRPWFVPAVVIALAALLLIFFASLFFFGYWRRRSMPFEEGFYRILDSQNMSNYEAEQIIYRVCKNDPTMESLGGSSRTDLWAHRSGILKSIENARNDEKGEFELDANWKKQAASSKELVLLIAYASTCPKAVHIFDALLSVADGTYFEHVQRCIAKMLAKDWLIHSSDISQEFHSGDLLFNILDESFDGILKYLLRYFPELDVQQECTTDLFPFRKYLERSLKDESIVIPLDPEIVELFAEKKAPIWFNKRTKSPGINFISWICSIAYMPQFAELIRKYPHFSQGVDAMVLPVHRLLDNYHQWKQAGLRRDFLQAIDAFADVNILLFEMYDADGRAPLHSFLEKVAIKRKKSGSGAHFPGAFEVEIFETLLLHSNDDVLNHEYSALNVTAIYRAVEMNLGPFVEALLKRPSVQFSAQSIAPIFGPDLDAAEAEYKRLKAPFKAIHNTET